MEQLSFKLNVFEGPLDLLLHLVRKNKVSLYDIPIAEITKQYMDYLTDLQEIDLPVTSDFLVMAATLLVIKSKMLLPKHEADIEEEDPRTELVLKLVEYQKYKDSLEFFENRFLEGQKIHTKTPEKIWASQKTYENIDGDLIELVKAFNLLLQKVEYKKPPQKEEFDPIISRKIHSVQDKKTSIFQLIRQKGKVNFLDLFDLTMERGEMVASFLAVLELIKENTIRILHDKRRNIFKLSYLAEEIKV